MARDEDFEPPEVPFQPKPTSVSIQAIPDSMPDPTNDFAGDSNHTTRPKTEDIHGAATVILDSRSRSAPRPAAPPREPQPASRRRPSQPGRPTFEDDLHSAPTMIIDMARWRGRRRI